MANGYDYDLVVLGAGPGGYVAAIRASQLGLKAAVVEKEKPGGVCLNIGCIPSKALIHQAELFRSISDLEHMGMEIRLDGFDYKKVFAKSRKAADTLSKGVRFLLNKNKIELITEEGKIKDPHTLSLSGGGKVTGGSLVIATGSSPRELPGFEFDEKRVLSSNGALMLEALPRSICILGGGAIGCEFAHIMNAFGVEVHLVEMLDQLLPLEDEEAVQVLARSFRRRGIKAYTATRASTLKRGSDSVTITLEGKGGKQELTTDMILVVVGRAPNTSGIGLEEVGVRLEKGYVATGDFYQTAVPGIFAIGDVLPTPMLAHVASKEGEIVAEHLAGQNPPPRLDPLSIPSAVYCEPQIASFGYTEKKAREQGIEVKKAVFPYRGAGKSVAVEKPEGLVKILIDPETGEIIGAHVAGAEATELIHELLLARCSELLPEDIAVMTHAHPSLSEAVMEAARAAEGWAIHG